MFWVFQLRYPDPHSTPLRFPGGSHAHPDPSPDLAQRVVGAIAGFLLAIVLATLALSGGQPRAVDYYVRVDEDTILVSTISGAGEWTRVVELQESDAQVRLVVRASGWPVGAVASIGREIRILIDLAGPLGDREIVDTYHVVPERDPPDSTPSLAPAPPASEFSNPTGIPSPLARPPPMAENDLRFTCGSPLAFGAAALTAPGGAESADHPAAEALRSLLQDGLLPMRHGWQLVVLDDTSALFLLRARPNEGFAYTSAELGVEDSGWTYVRSGQCDIQPLFEDVGPAHWELAPGEALTTTSQVFRVLVTELECASGASPEGRVVPAAMLRYDDSLVVVFGVKPLSGAQTCQPGPPAEVTVDLGEPLGERELMDGAVFPPESRGGPP